MRIVVIEDEIQSRRLLVKMLSNYCEDAEVVGQAHDVYSGVQVIKEQKPDLVFIDIELKGGTGFDILKELTYYKFAVVFVTGYQDYAIKAIKYAAIDYLLKPIDLTELRNALKLFKDKKITYTNRISHFLDAIDKPKPNKIIIRSGNDNIVILLEEIKYLCSDGNYTKFALSGNTHRYSSYPLKHYEEILPHDIFLRVHKSYIVNILKVASYSSGRVADLSLKSGEVIPIAARRKSHFLKVMKEINL